MSKIHDLLDEVRAEVAPSDETLGAAKEHRDAAGETGRTA